MESFIDFQFYEISGEPSAFFVEPLVVKNKVIGWFILQFAINKIDNIFRIDKGLGQTGEIIMVNHDHFLLTNSRFFPQSTILKQKLDCNNIKQKFKEGKGKKEVTDYCGNRVLSTFEVFDFLGSKWLIIAKINKKEVLTDFFIKQGGFISIMPDRKDIRCLDHPPGNDLNKEKTFEVDMDEYRRGNKNDLLYSHGISTCTGIVISLPGNFAYMAHISPYDHIYGEHKTDILNQMLQKIEFMEIRASEKHKLKFYIVTPAQKIAQSVINELIHQGYFLHQIFFPTIRNADVANIWYKTAGDRLYVEWKNKSQNTTMWQSSSIMKSIGEIYEMQE